jgi:hypothetical protein
MRREKEGNLLNDAYFNEIKQQIKQQTCGPTPTPNHDNTSSLKRCTYNP